METTENETLNAKLRNMVQPIVTLLDVLDEMNNENLSYVKKIRMINLLQTSLIEDAKNSVKRLIE